MKQKELDKILKNHRLWLDGEGGERADLSFSTLSGSNLRGSNLSGSNLRGSDLSGSNLRGSDLSFSNLSGSNLRGSNLRGSNLRGSDLSFSNLSFSTLRGSDLSFSNLSGSDLSGSTLSGAVLRDCIGDGRHVISIQAGCYNVAYTDEIMQIGCEQHAIKDWWEYDDDTISLMDDGALDWWKTWKPILRKIIKANPAEPTGSL